VHAPTSDVSAVICTYNREREVCRAVESVLAQTRPALQVIVVDDGSTDGTGAALRRFGDRIEYLWQPNRGASAARNAAIGRARGRFVAFLDSDDEWLPFHLADLLEIAETEGGPDWVFSTRLVTMPGATSPEPEVPAQLEALVDGRGVAADYFRLSGSGVLSATSTLMVRRDVLQALGGFDTTLRAAEDLDLWWRIARDHPRVGVARRPSVVMERDREDSLSGSARNDASGRSDLRYAESIAENVERMTRAGRLEAFRPVAALHLDPVVERALLRRDREVMRKVGWRMGALLPFRRRLPLYLCLASGPPGTALVASLRELRSAWKARLGRRHGGAT
jgi:glycosyltransferase involved in cell wall biosynthesis